MSGPNLNEADMEKISRELLHRVQAAFPCVEWSDDELDDLVKPNFGVITGFSELLVGIERIGKRDLEEIAPAGTLVAPGPS